MRSKPMTPEGSAKLASEYELVTRIGPQPGIRADRLLPPLPHDPDLLAAEAALHCPSGGWEDINTQSVDPRAPWRHAQMDSIGSADRVSGGFVIIRGVGGPLRGWKATLIPIPQPGQECTTHDLIYPASGRLVRFGCRADAESEMRPTVDADGVPFPKQAWENLPGGVIISAWVPRRYDRGTGTSEARWRGRSAEWKLMNFCSPCRIWVARNGVWITDPTTGAPREFPNAPAARRYCEMADGR